MSTPTPISSATPYCTGAQFLSWYDARTVADALSDNGVPVGKIDDHTVDPLVVAADPKLNQILLGASGYVEAGCFVGNKYTPTMLAALTGASAVFLAEIVANVAAPKVLGRRFIEFPEYKERNQEAMGAVKALAEGVMIFGLQEVMDAGLISDQVETPTDVEARNMITLQAQSFFGRRANRSMPFQGGNSAPWWSW